MRRRRPAGADGRSPFLDGGGAAAGERRIEAALVLGGGVGGLGRSGGSPVGRVDPEAARHTSTASTSRRLGREPGGTQSGVSGVARRTWSVRSLIRSARACRYGPHSGWSARRWGMPGSHGSGPATSGWGSRWSRTAARSAAESISRIAAGSGEALDRVVAVGVQAAAGGRAGWARPVRWSGRRRVARRASSSAFDELRRRRGRGGGVQGVVVAGGGLAEPRWRGRADRGVRWWRSGRRRRGPGSVRGCRWRCWGGWFGPDHRVRVAVADDVQVEVVGVPAAGRHRVQLLPGLVAGQRGRAWCRR